VLAVVLALHVATIMRAILRHDRTEGRRHSDIVVVTAIIKPGFRQTAEF
jgi:hypothetical protein